MHKIATILRKEWAEVFKNRMVLFTIVFMPLMLTAIPLVILFSMRGEIQIASVGASDVPAQFRAFCPVELNSGECMLVFMVSQFVFMFMIIPLSIPAAIAAYSVVGEKTTRSLEPLLATPISTVELLLGKSLAAVVPAVLATFLAFAIFAVGTWILVPNRIMLRAILDARWLLAVTVIGPLLAWLSVTFSIMVSSRVNDPRVAEQMSVVIIVPLLALFFGQMAGLLIIDSQLVIVIGLALVLVDALLTYFSVQLFQRETILTRWK
jgi:ABC-2 type transport system permease protein